MKSFKDKKKKTFFKKDTRVISNEKCSYTLYIYTNNFGRTKHMSGDIRSITIFFYPVINTGSHEIMKKKRKKNYGRNKIVLRGLIYLNYWFGEDSITIINS